MNKAIGLFALAIALVALPAAAQAPARGPQECAALRNLQLPGVALTEISAEWMPAGPPPNLPPGFKIVLPAHCRMEGTLERRKGVDGQPYGIGFALALPGTWNGRFLFQGGGGFNGVLAPPYGTTVAGDMSALARGFAVVSTDSGHRAPKGNALDTTFLGDQQASLDFAYRAVDRVTAVAKVIIAQHYVQPIARSYYVGCSTGGREAMLAAQRHPLEFDGVIAGAPNMRVYYS
ncbi:MAG TPA: tannase/feruloyl esterase family alpha/beta hydrolase, partial [Vicinamibacterales bacterium]|nr:tannase/feruloyl esterase family alpha/beta hydrolase [Vicinamibacterales bacterium]